MTSNTQSEPEERRIEDQYCGRSVRERRMRENPDDYPLADSHREGFAGIRGVTTDRWCRVCEMRIDQPRHRPDCFVGWKERALRAESELDSIPSQISEAVKAEREWQPIETAPKDGTHILACDWSRADSRTTFYERPPTVVHYYSQPGEEGFYTSVNELAPERPFNATHWMPLPESPATAIHTRGES